MRTNYDILKISTYDLNHTGLLYQTVIAHHRCRSHVIFDQLDDIMDNWSCLVQDINNPDDKENCGERRAEKLGLSMLLLIWVWQRSLKISRLINGKN